MAKVNVTALAQAAVARKINPQFIPGLSYFQFFQQIPLSPADFVDDATAQQMADLLGGVVVKMKPRVLWMFGQPNNSLLPNLPLQNFIGIKGVDGAPDAETLLVVNGGDLAQAATQAFTFGLPQEIATEQALAYLFGAAGEMSGTAQAALAMSPISTWPAAPVYWFKP